MPLGLAASKCWLTFLPTLLSVNDKISAACFSLFSLKGCVYCETEEKGNICLPYEEDSPSPGLCDTSEAKEEESGELTSPRKETQT